MNNTFQPNIASSDYEKLHFALLCVCLIKNIRFRPTVLDFTYQKVHCVFEYFHLTPKALCVLGGDSHRSIYLFCSGAARSLEKRKGNAKKKQEKRKRRRKKVCEQNYAEKNCDTIIRKNSASRRRAEKTLGFL